MSGPAAPVARPRAQGELAYLIEPRFPGGTSSAVAHELRAIRGLVRPRVHALESRMLRDRPVAPALAAALAEERLELRWNAPVVGAERVILHNPSFLKFQDTVGCRIVARDLWVVAHENFLGPGGSECFDVAHCLDAIGAASLAVRRVIAPISGWNRRSVFDWLARNPTVHRWDVADEDWFNICEFDMRPPAPSPRDRRGRLSRPGAEKFPPLAALDLAFSPAAEANVILGSELLMRAAEARPHWSVLPFGAIDAESFFDRIDFLVYHTAPGYRDSFGRVVAEAVAAGKVAIGDPELAETFGPAVIGAAPSEVDAVIGALLAEPGRYRDWVRAAQAHLGRFSAEAFRGGFLRRIGRDLSGAAA